MTGSKLISPKSNRSPDMAWTFSLSAECGVHESSAKEFAQYFEGMLWVLSNGQKCLCDTDIFQDIEEN